MTTAEIKITARDDTDGGIRSVGNKLQGLASQAKDTVGSLAGIGLQLGAIAAVSVIGIKLKGAIDTLDQLDDLAEKSGIAVEAISGLRFAGEVVGTSTEAIATGVKKLAVAMAAASGGAKEQGAIFDALGVNYKKLDGTLRSTDDVLGDVASQFANFKDGPEKAALAIQLFGKSGEALIPLLNKGGEGIATLSQEAKRLGVVFSADLAASAAEFNDNLKKIQLASEGTAAAIAGKLLPTINTLMNAFISAKDDGASFAALVGGGLNTALQAASVLGLEVAFVFKSVGREIGAVAAQIATLPAALLSLDFTGFNAISDAVKADGIAARKELDKLTAAILNPNAKTAGGGRGFVNDDRFTGKTAAPIVSSGDTGGAARSAASAYDALNKSVQERLRTMAEELTLGRALTEQEKFSSKLKTDIALASTKLTASQKQGLAVSLAKAEADGQLLDLQRAELKQAKETAEARSDLRRKESEDIAKYLADESAARIATVKAANEAVSQAQDEFDNYGKTRSQVQELTLARLKDKLAAVDAGSEIGKSIQAQIDAQDKLIAIYQKGEARDVAEKTAKEAAEEWNRTAKSIESDLTNALLRGFESGKGFGKNLVDTLRNMFNTLVLRPVISAIVNPVAQGITGTLGIGGQAQASGSSGGAGGFGNAGSIVSSFGNLATIGSQVLTGGMSVVNAFGTVAANVTGTGLSGLLATNGAFGTAAAGAGVTGSISSIFAAIPGWGWAALAAGAILGLSGRGETRQGATYKTGADGKAYRSEGASDQFDSATAIKLFNGTTDAINGIFTALGSKAKLTDFTAGLESSKNGKGFEFAGGKIDGKGFGEDGGRYGGQFAFKSQDTNQALQNYTVRLQQTTIEALQAATDIPQTIKDMIKVDAKSLGKDAVAKLLTDIGIVVTTVKTFNDAVLTLPFENLKNLSFDAAAGLIAAGGGLQSLQAYLGTFFKNFYTPEEQRDQKFKEINAATAGSGLDAATATRQSFKDLVNAQDLTTESGRKTYVALLSVSGALSDLLPPLDDLAGKISQIMRGLLDERSNLDVQLLEARGDTKGATALRRTNAIKGFKPDEIQAYDDNQGIRDEIKYIGNVKAADEAAAVKASGIATTRRQLEISIMSLQGDKAGALAAQRDDELAAMDESLRGLKRVEYGLIDVANAAAETAQVAARLGSALSGLGDTRFDLENELLAGDGKASEARKRIRDREIARLGEGQSADDVAKIASEYDYNESLRDQIKAQQDAKRAAEAAIEAAQRSAQAAQSAAEQVANAAQRSAQAAQSAAEQAANAARAVSDAWANIVNSILGEVARIRGADQLASPANQAQAQAAFAIATTQAEAGSQEAAKQLPKISQDLLAIFEKSATSSLDLARARAQVAGRLEQTASLLGGTPQSTILAPPSPATAAVPQVFVPVAPQIFNSEAAIISELQRLNVEVARLSALQADGNQSSAKTSDTLLRATRGGTSIYTVPA